MKKFGVLIIAVLASGCSQVDSEDLKTSGMRAEINVYAKQNGTSEVEVQLEAGSGGDGTDVNLTSGDTLTVTVLEQTTTLTREENIFNEITYERSVNTIAGGTEFTVSLHREDGKDAPASTVSLPPEFDITSPNDQDRFNFSDVISVTWDANADGFDFFRRLTTSCDNSEGTITTVESDDISDDGIFQLDLDDLVTGTEVTDPDACELTIELHRKTTGALDGAYGEGGYVRARQQREIEIFLEP